MEADSREDEEEEEGPLSQPCSATIQRHRSDETDYSDVGANDLVSPAPSRKTCDAEADSRSCTGAADGTCGETSNGQECGLDVQATAEAAARDLAAREVAAASSEVKSDNIVPFKRRGAGKASAGTLKKPKREAGKNGLTGHVETVASQSRRASSTSMPPPAPPCVGAPTEAVALVGQALEVETHDARQTELETLRKELEMLREQYNRQRSKMQASMKAQNEGKQVIANILTQVAKRELTEAHDRVQAATYRLGHCRQAMAGVGLNQIIWSGGYEEEEIYRIRGRIEEDRRSINEERKVLTKLGADADDIWERREILNHRNAYLTREEQSLKDREARLQVERDLHLKRQQRLEAAVRSSFNGCPLMKDRYQLLNMLGRGGFSEVYRAFDLESNTYCAVKIHELGKDMAEVHRQNYIRRAMREYEIQKNMKHPRVVTLQDCFAISSKAFATVLELCEGDTLDEYMKRYGPCLPEREARGIIIQVLSGLRYLNSNSTGNKIIHYDLKPGNLFFQSGEVKIADFGLSKIVHESNPGESIDLTSQGAGTYWYLPPECMEMQVNQGATPKISNKVDVWSTGVIFYELLFGKRPFGHGQPQEALRRAALAGQAFGSVQLPTTPKVSTECARFLKRLLTQNRDERPDVIEAFNDAYVRGAPKKSKASAAPPEADAGDY